MAYNETVNVNINANTTDASADVEKLERNIATLDGTINLVGGSIEVLAGSLALSGAVSEETAQQFETAAVGAIALADGAKRMIEGYKTLATNTKLLTAVQRIYNVVMSANPIFIIVGVLAAVTAGVIALTKALKSQREEQQRINELEADQTYQRLQERSLRIAQLRGESAVQLAERQEEIAKNAADIARQEVALAKTEEDKATAMEAYKKAFDDYIVSQEATKAARREDNEKTREEAERLAKAYQQAKENAEELTRVVRDELFEGMFNVGKLTKEFTDNLSLDGLETLEEFYDEADDMDAEFDHSYRERLDKRKEYLKKTYNETADFNREMLNLGIDAAQLAAETVIGENKSLAKAMVLIDAAQAAVGIIRSANDPRNAASILNPPAYIAANLAFLAATTAASIAQINQSESGGGGTNAPGAPGGAGGPGAMTSGIPQIPGFSNSGVTNLNAVVLSGDMTSAQAQDAAIRNRRRFG